MGNVFWEATPRDAQWYVEAGEPAPQPSPADPQSKGRPESESARRTARGQTNRQMPARNKEHLPAGAASTGKAKPTQKSLEKPVWQRNMSTAARVNIESGHAGGQESRVNHGYQHEGPLSTERNTQPAMTAAQTTARSAGSNQGKRKKTKKAESTGNTHPKVNHDDFQNEEHLSRTTEMSIETEDVGYENELLSRCRDFLARHSSTKHTPGVEENVVRKVSEMEREHRELSAVVTALRDCFTERRRRTVNHDGYFQMMGDDHNRDKLVKRYAQLYDKADLVSDALERISDAQSGLTQEDIEDKASALFQTSIKVSSDKVGQRLERFAKNVHNTLLAELGYGDTLPEEKSAEGIDRNTTVTIIRNKTAANSLIVGAAPERNTFAQTPVMCLIKEFLRRHSTRFEVPDDFMEDILEWLRQDEFYQALQKACQTTTRPNSEPREEYRITDRVSHTLYSPNGSSGVQGGENDTVKVKNDVVEVVDYVTQAVSFAWYCHILPVALLPKDENPIVKDIPFDGTCHRRHPGMDRGRHYVMEIIWPALVSADGKKCFEKAIVVTGEKKGNAVKDLLCT